MSIEQEIRDLTVAINSLTYAILSKPVQADIKEIVEELTEVAQELPVKPIKKAKTVAFTAPEPTPTPMSDEEALAIVANEPVPQTLSKDELQQQCLKLIRNDRAIKPRLQSWLKDRGSDSLADLDEKHLADFQAFVDAVASEVK